ncbi:cytochrome c oxidase subunit II [Shimazuella sp. AN120528]|uniref:cytochrome c oxidase subunit II n=1 Tax=Shimazuella soli TaxID=1892854 RepID=UPI001F0CFD98|nr:cytochrome c oxidase subunit II [Shimazuella soli]
MERLRVWRIGLLVSLVMLLLAGCSGDPSLSVLDPKGSAAKIQLNLIYWSLGLMTVVFVIVITIYVYVLVRYRKRKGQNRMPEQVHGSTKLEIIWTVIPIAALIALAIPTVQYTFDLAKEPPAKDTVIIDVTGHQYWWEFKYPQYGITTAQEVHIPVGKKILFRIHGKDVLHAFWIPSLGGKVDVVPGRVNTLTLDAQEAKVYQGKCAELCGAGHALMDFKVFAQKQADFDKWLAAMKQPVASVSASSSEANGEKIFKQNCMGCHAGINPNIQGPNLNKFATRSTIAGILPHNDENIKIWLKNPQAVKPGTLMPKIDYLNKDELNDLIKYLDSRK